MSIELETLQENTQRLTNVMDNYLDVVRDSLSGMADKVSRLAGSIHGSGESSGDINSNSILSSMIEWKLNELYGLVSEMSTNNTNIEDFLEYLINERALENYEEEPWILFPSTDQNELMAIYNEINSFLLSDIETEDNLLNVETGIDEIEQAEEMEVI